MESKGEGSASFKEPRAQAARPERVLWTVQWLRAAAALMVVIGHTQTAVATIELHVGHGYERWAVLPWGASVDLFFVISGFIMVHASRNQFAAAGGRATFVRRRLERLAPLYWLTTSLSLALLAAATLKGGDRFPGAAAILASYLFLPFDTYGDGYLFPVFDLGWTLNYEMLFYALLAGVLGWPRRRAVGMLLLLIAAMAIAGGLLSHLPPAPWFWTRPIIVDFGVGVCVGLLAAEPVRLSPPVRWVIVAIGLTVLALDPAHLFNGPLGTTVANGWPRVIWSGLPAGLVLAGAVLGSQPRLHSLLEPVTYLGDASYSLYLLHPFALIAMEKLAQKSAAVRAIDGRWLVVATVVAAIAMAALGHRWIEQPIARLIRERRGRRRPVPTGSSAHPQGI